MGNPTLEIPKDVIDPIIKAEIARAITAAMGGGNAIVVKAITTILATPVGEDGKASTYSSDRNRPWIEWAVGDCVKAATKEALQSALVGHKDQIRKSIIAELSRRNSPLIKQLASTMAESICKEETLKYRLSISIDK